MNYLTYLPVFDNLTKPQQASLTNSAFVCKFNKNEILHNGSQTAQVLSWCCRVSSVPLQYPTAAERSQCIVSLSAIFASFPLHV